MTHARRLPMSWICSVTEPSSRTVRSAQLIGTVQTRVVPPRSGTSATTIEPLRFSARRACCRGRCVASRRHAGAVVADRDRQARGRGMDAQLHRRGGRVPGDVGQCLAHDGGDVARPGRRSPPSPAARRGRGAGRTPSAGCTSATTSMTAARRPPGTGGWSWKIETRICLIASSRMLDDVLESAATTRAASSARCGRLHHQARPRTPAGSRGRGGRGRSGPGPRGAARAAGRAAPRPARARSRRGWRTSWPSRMSASVNGRRRGRGTRPGSRARPRGRAAAAP